MRGERTLSNAIAQTSDWTSGYYNSVEFYHWEPELINRVSVNQLKQVSSGKKTIDDLLAKRDVETGSSYRTMDVVKRTEEPFNHILELFFRLAPLSFFEAMAAELNLASFDIRPDILTRLVEYLITGTQPDMLLTTPQQTLFVEVKPPHGKSSAEQFAKYAYTMREFTQIYNLKNLYLIYLANGEYSHNFPKHLNDVEALKSAATLWTDTTTKGPIARLEAARKTELLDAINAMHIHWLSFSQLAKIIEGTLNRGETEKRLGAGLIAEMHRRDYL